MQSVFPNIFCFIDDFKNDYIKKLDKKITIIFRNYHTKPNVKKLKELVKFCKSNDKKIILANNPKLALNLGFDGSYIPSFNKITNFKFYKRNSKFLLLGSAHNQVEIKVKEKQGVDIIFLAPTFKVNKSKNYLGVIKFNLLSQLTNKKVIALGGVNEFNLKKINILKADGFASISFFKKKAPISWGLFNKIIIL